MIIRTRNSTYEIDEDNKRVRRLGERAEGRLGSTAWQTYDCVPILVVGKSALFVWPDGTELLPGSKPGSVPVSITSTIVEIIKDEEVN